MTEAKQFAEEKRDLRVILMALNGDVKSATATLAERFPQASIKNIARSEIESQRLVGRLKALRAYKPDVFAVCMESVDWQRGQDMLRLFGLLAGAKRVAMIDTRGGFEEETRNQILLHIPQRLAHEAMRSSLSVVKARRHLTSLEAKIAKTPEAAATGKPSNSPPEILFLRATPGAGTQKGGAATHINGFVNAVVRQGASVRLIANDALAGLDEQMVKLKIIPLLPVGLTRSAFDLHNDLVFTEGVVREIQMASPDFIYQRYSRFTSAGVCASLVSRRPLFLEYNGSEVWVGRNWDRVGMLDLLERYERLNLAAAARILVVSNVERDNLERVGIPAEKIVVNPNGVDTGVFRPGLRAAEIRQSFGIAAAHTLVGFVSTFGPWHGALELAQAIKRIASNLAIRFLLVGSGSLHSQVKQLLEQEVIAGKVIFTGAVEHDQVPGLLDACDILVSPHIPLAEGADFFGSPTKLFEYMAMGKGIVASRLGQIGEVLTHEETALLIEPGNVQELSSAIVRLAHSPALRRKLGAAARQAAIDHHTWKRNAQNVLDAYDAWRKETGDQ